MMPPKPILLSILFVTLLLSCLPGYGQPMRVDNPVLPGVADAGVFKFNGEYYIGGVFTNGSFYVSKDLVHWQGPVHVFSMHNEWTEGPSAEDSQIHANDINYLNGVFHQYWSVNYWGKDQHVVHIGHATAPRVLGPYREPRTDTWLTNRIDPELFVDDDGKCYFYWVQFTDGNTIWGSPMKDPGTLSGTPRYLFASLPNTWETLDNRVEEGPWVIKYRDRYYLMYNTNHTSPRWGNYALGVAVADSPLGFNHGGKYPYPVVRSNQIDLEDTFVDLLKYTGPAPNQYGYTFDNPGSAWTAADFTPTEWQLGKPGFSSTPIKNSTTRKTGTRWETPEIFVRKTFMLNPKNTKSLMLRLHHDGDTEVYLNGQRIYQQSGHQYLTRNLDAKALSLLRDGENVLALHSTKGQTGNYLDVALFDTQGQPADDILYSPGQPNLVRGPNGFEWWLVYFGDKNAEKRSQFINRVHFFDRQLFVDGPTGRNTPGYHPPPALPTFSDVFEADNAKQWQQRWQVKGGQWALRDKELVQTGNGGTALIKSPRAQHYLFETGLRIGGHAAPAGLYAWWQDETHWLTVGLNPQTKSWQYTLREGDQPQTVAAPLPPGFDFGVYHSLGVCKNGNRFEVRIDGLPAPGNPVITAVAAGEGTPGLYATGGEAAFDGVLYTIGWDEYDGHITGWSTPAGSTSPAGNWEVTDQGLAQTLPAGESVVLKGDRLYGYEFSVQVTAADTTGRAGAYPVYADPNNYLKATFDFGRGQLLVSGKTNGKVLEERQISLARRSPHYADMRYTDFIEKHFTFPVPTYLNALTFPKTPHLLPDTTIENMYEYLNIFYRQGNQWHPLTGYREETSPHPGFDKISFTPVRAEALKFVNKRPDDSKHYLYKIGVDEAGKQSYNLNVAKRKDWIVLLVDGREVLRLKNEWPASRVGLVTENAKAHFNGMMLFHYP